MICASCGEETARASCERCGAIAALDRRFRLDRVLYRAPQLTLYAGRHLASREAVVIAEHPLSGPVSPGWRAALEDTLARHRALAHPGVALEVDAVVALTRGSPALFGVRPYVEGWAISRLLVGAQTVPVVLALLEELLDLLSALHLTHPPVVHGNLYADNLLRRADDGRLVLVGFTALAAAAREVSSEPWEPPVPFAHLPPEFFDGGALPVVDMYGVGVLAVQLLSGLEPRRLLDREGTLRWRGRIPSDPDLELLLEDLLQASAGRRSGDAAEALAWVRALRAR